VAAALRSGASTWIFVPTGIFQLATSAARASGAPTCSLLCHLPVTGAPTNAVDVSVAGRTYHATFARGAPTATFAVADQSADGAATHTGRADTW
jgi:hypothetical protein